MEYNEQTDEEYQLMKRKVKEEGKKLVKMKFVILDAKKNIVIKALYLDLKKLIKYEDLIVTTEFYGSTFNEFIALSAIKQYELFFGQGRLNISDPITKYLAPNYEKEFNTPRGHFFKAGAPDFIIWEDHRHKKKLMVEFKGPSDSISKIQKEWHSKAGETVHIMMLSGPDESCFA